MPPPSSAAAHDPDDFSVVLGGPLYQLVRRAHLSGDALELWHRRIVVISMVAWLPLLILSLVGGRAWGTVVAVPFLLDVEVHARFLLTVPLLIVAELVVHQRLRPVVRQFLERDLVPAASRARFDAAVENAQRLRNSVAAEAVLLGLVYVNSVFVWQYYGALDVATWQAVPGEGGRVLSAAGAWFAYVSLPLFQFILLRWYFRLFVWTRFLWQVSRMELRLVPTHPDRVGGLGFLATAVTGFNVLAVAQGALLSGQLANRIFFLGAALPQFKVEIAATVILALCVILGPLLVFAPQLMRTKREGLREYGTLAERYVREFDAKWLRGGARADEQLLGSADLQSLADLGNSFETVRGMRLVLVGRDAVIQLALATVLPILPLVLTMMSVEDLLARFLGIVF